MDLYNKCRVLVDCKQAHLCEFWKISRNEKATQLPKFSVKAICWRHQLQGWGSGGMLPWEIFKLGLSKRQFPTFPGLELEIFDLAS